MRCQSVASLEELVAVGPIATVDIKRSDPALCVCNRHLLLYKSARSPIATMDVAECIKRTFKWCSAWSYWPFAMSSLRLCHPMCV